MQTEMTISRTGSFRYETTEPSKPCKGVCVISSASKNQHVITSSVDIYTANKKMTWKRIWNGDANHSDSLHCHHSPEYDDRHGHSSYNNRKQMMQDFKKRLPPEHAQVLKQLKYDATQKNNKNLEANVYSLNKPSLNKPSLNKPSLKWTAYMKSLFNKISRKK